MTRFHKRSLIPCSAEELYRWHMRPGAFQRLTPPWDDVRIVSRSSESIGEGQTVTLRVRKGLPMTWTAFHRDFEEGRSFTDEQQGGPFRTWVHSHRFLPAQESGHCILEDDILYELPLGAVGELVAGRMIRKDLERMFAFRHTRTRNDMSRHQEFQDEPRQKIAISGASGMIGSALTAFLTTGGHEVLPLVRDREQEGVFWDPSSSVIDAQALEGVDTVIHLAGENVAGRWTAQKRQRIMESRRQGTRLVTEALAGLEHKPKTLISASAVGIYGDQKEALVTEETPPGEGFLAEVTREWEAACQPARDAGIRVVNTRIGVVLSPEGGALGAMLTPFRLGLGGVIGSGEQYMSWISLDDVIGAMHHLIFRDDVEGPVNLVAPEPVTNREFTKTLGKKLGRPTIARVPSFAIKFATGDMGEEMLLYSARVSSEKLQSCGFSFLHSELEAALQAVLP